jgi:phosphatidylglycerol:prolipoprotein diacylglycerol transferase
VGHDTHPETVHPTQLYEGVAGLGVYAGLGWLYRRKSFDGQVFAAYLIASGVVRFCVEFFRGDYAHRIWGEWLSPAQPLALVLVAAGVGLWWFRAAGGRRRK